MRNATWDAEKGVIDSNIANVQDSTTNTAVSAEFAGLTGC
jgi:hypothetical protein